MKGIFVKIEGSPKLGYFVSAPDLPGHSRPFFGRTVYAALDLLKRYTMDNVPGTARIDVVNGRPTCGIFFRFEFDPDITISPVCVDIPRFARRINISLRQRGWTREVLASVLGTTAGALSEMTNPINALTYIALCDIIRTTYSRYII